MNYCSEKKKTEGIREEIIIGEEVAICGGGGKLNCFSRWGQSAWKPSVLRNYSQYRGKIFEWRDV